MAWYLIVLPRPVTHRLTTRKLHLHFITDEDGADVKEFSIPVGVPQLRVELENNRDVEAFVEFSHPDCSRREKHAVRMRQVPTPDLAGVPLCASTNNGMPRRISEGGGNQP